MPSIAAIKIAQRQAGLTDPQYRALLLRTAGVNSSKDLDADGRLRVYRAILDVARPNNKRPLERKVWALWYALKPTLIDVHSPIAYLLAIAARANSLPVAPESLTSLTNQQLIQTVEALKSRLPSYRRFTPGHHRFSSPLRYTRQILD